MYATNNILSQTRIMLIDKFHCIYSGFVVATGCLYILDIGSDIEYKGPSLPLVRGLYVHSITTRGIYKGRVFESVSYHIVNFKDPN